MTDTPKKWHVDKTFPLALIAAIAIQTAVALLYFGRLEQRVTQIEEKIIAGAGQNEQIARIQERMVSQAATLARIEDVLNRFTRR